VAVKVKFFDAKTKKSSSLVSLPGMVETPRLQAKKKLAKWPQAMSQSKLD